MVKQIPKSLKAKNYGGKISEKSRRDPDYGFLIKSNQKPCNCLCDCAPFKRHDRKRTTKGKTLERSRARLQKI